MVTLLLALGLVMAQQSTLPAPSTAEALWAAARAGDRAGVERALAAGVPVDAGTRYQQTALMFAAEKGHLEIVRLLLDRGANVNQKDTFYGMTAVSAASKGDHIDVLRLLVERGFEDAAGVLMIGIRERAMPLVTAALASPHLDPSKLARAVTAAETSKDAAIIGAVKAAAAAHATAPPPVFAVDAATLRSYVGTYRNDESGVAATVTLDDAMLRIAAPGGPAIALVPRAAGVFAGADMDNYTVTFAGRGGLIERVIIDTQGRQFAIPRAASASTPAPSAAVAPAADPTLKAPAPRAAVRPWPSFRGANASGNADGQGAPVEWDVPAGRNVAWRTEIPGFANASPIVWHDRVIALTAISSANDRTFRTGNYGDVAPVNDMSEHVWKIYALDAGTGAIAWEREIHRGVPGTKRHTKSSQANSTPVTDGRRIVSVFGAIGLIVAHDMEGRELWRRDIGVIDSGWFYDAGAQWGHSSSPIIYGDTVILQADQQKGSFIAAYDLATGADVWKTMREDEIPTWGTPAVLPGAAGDEIVTNGTKVRGYDARTGALLWTLGPNSEITVGTPAVVEAGAGAGVAIITGGYPPVRTVYAVKAGSRGDLTLPEGKTSSDAIAWSNNEGTYIPSPLAYRGLVYLFNNNGILAAFDVESGERVLRARVGGGGAFSASPIAADGRLYFTSEDGDVFVVKAGAPYLEIAKNTVGEVLMATPAISNGMIFFRTLSAVVAIRSPNLQ